MASRDRELAALVGDLGEEHGLEQEVAELLAQLRGTAALDGLEHLVGFLEHERPQRGLRLLAVPRAAVGRPQRPHDVDQPVEPFTGRSHPRTVAPIAPIAPFAPFAPISKADQA